MMDLSECKPIEAANHETMLSPTQSQTKLNELSTAFGNGNDQNDSQIDFANLTIDIDQTNKQILVDVSISVSQNVQSDANQSLNVTKCECNMIKEDTFIKSPHGIRLTRSSINTAVSSTEIESKFYKSEITDNDSMKMDTTPTVKHSSFEAKRTPIGVIRLRKVSLKTETPEMNIPEDETYEIVIVDKSQHSEICAENFDSMNSTKHEFSGISPAKNYPLMPMNSEIASQTTTKAHPFPFSPRIILHRINSIDEYHQSLSIQATPKVTAVKNKHKTRITKTERSEKGTCHK